MRSWWSTKAVVASLALIGCGDDDGQCDYSVCDISDPGCVESIAVAVSCRRDGDVIDPEVRFATLDEVAQEREPPTAEQLELERQYWAGEALVGLMPEGYDPVQTFSDSFDGVLAFYTSSDDAITVVLNDNASRRLRYEVMVHEMIHAYQDAEHDLEALHEEHAQTFDRFLGLRASTEGEAELYTLFASLELDNVSHSRVDWGGTFGRYGDATLEAARDSETPSLDALRLFPYAWGSWLSWQAWQADGPSAVSRLVGSPPDSVREVMRPYAGETYGDDNADALLELKAVPVISGHTYLGGGAQGAWLYNAMLQRTAGSSDLWSSSTENLAADHLSIFRNDATGEPIAVWRLLLESGNPPLDGAQSIWKIGEANATHLYYGLEGTWVLIATDGSDGHEVREAIVGWESQEEAYERAGLGQTGPVRRRDTMERWEAFGAGAALLRDR